MEDPHKFRKYFHYILSLRKPTYVDNVALLHFIMPLKLFINLTLCIHRIQLQAKQKLKFYYGNMNERQFRNVYRKALQKRGNTTENFIGLLERRLDTIIYRAKFAITVFSARQLINHGHVRVNGKKVDISSFLVNENDTIEIKDKSKELVVIAGALVSKEREIPDYIQMDEKNKIAKLIRVPKFSEVPYPSIMEPNLVVEYYSR